jgi:hypothetical protein
LSDPHDKHPKTIRITKHMAELSFSQRVVVAPDTLINIVGNEAVLLNLANEQYYGLDESGASFWQALTTSATIQAAYEKLLDAYEVEPERLRLDLINLLGKLTEQGLIEIND